MCRFGSQVIGEDGLAISFQPLSVCVCRLLFLGPPAPREFFKLLPGLGGPRGLLRLQGGMRA